MTTALFLVLTAVIVYLGVFIYYMQKEHNRTNDEREARHRDDMQKLLDRIQANSFAEYKTAEVRVIKAQKDDKQEPPVQMV